jgi:hypothetical protein
MTGTRLECDSSVPEIIRMIAEAIEGRINKNSGGDTDFYEVRKYGTQYENDTFMMHPYCWCDKEDCPWCEGEEWEEDSPEAGPNFHYKPLGFKVWWYKYIGRGMVQNKELTVKEMAAMLFQCLESLDG